MAPIRHDQDNFRTSTGLHDFVGAFLGIFSTKGGFHGFIDDTVANTYGISRGLFLAALFAGLWAALWRMIPNLPTFAFGWLVGTMPIWILPASAIGAGAWWLWFVRSWQQFKQGGMLLEIKMPNNVVKSPRAMEAVFAHFRNFGGATNTFINKLWNGGVSPTFSFEIVSVGGKIHFYVWAWPMFRRTIEEAFYANYPDVEIVEAEDYAKKFRFDPSVYEAHCFDWRLEPRTDAYPLKTYVDWELEEDPDEEYKIDPFSQVLETMGSMKPGEQAWVQILITKYNDKAPGATWLQTKGRYETQVKEAVDKIRKEVVTGGKEGTEIESWRATAARLEQFHAGEILRSIERNASKIRYSVGMRGTYITNPPDIFNNNAKENFRYMWRPIGDEDHRNHLRHRRWHPPFDYVWQDLWNMRVNLVSRRYYDCYRRRSHFHPPWIFPHNVMSTEVLATLWHPPSQGMEARGVQRIESRKKSAPHNLPT